MSRIVVTGTLAAAVADAGTFTVSYPNAEAPELAYPIDEGDLYVAQEHEICIGQSAAMLAPKSFTLTLGTASITVTNKSGVTWAAGEPFKLSLEKLGAPLFASSRDGKAPQRVARAAKGSFALINLGAPDAIVTNGVMDQQNRTNGGALLVNGTLASGGVVVLDKPRAVIADSGGADTAVITVTGKDEYGNTMKENITLNGTTAVAGIKAFKTITALDCSAAIANTAFIGTSKVLGLPSFLPAIGLIVKELQNGTVASAGTAVAGLTTGGGSTATTADVRGTYTPAATMDGDIVIQLLAFIPDAGYRGMAQYAG